MKYPVGLDRRAFMRDGVSVLALIAGGFSLYLAGLGARSDSGRAAGELLEALRDAMPRAENALGLGLACLGAAPGFAEALARNDDRRLGAQDIEGRLRSALGEDVRSLQRSGLRSRIATRTREDFRSGRTVCVEGWMLSQTEVLLYTVLAVA